MDLIARLHAFWTKIGVSPKVADPFVVGLVAVVVTWITSGSFDLDQVKLLVVTFAYGILGVAAPPVAGQTVKKLRAVKQPARHPNKHR